MGPSVSSRESPLGSGRSRRAVRDRPLERPEGANGRFWVDSGRAPVRAPISAHLLAQRGAQRKSTPPEPGRETRAGFV